MASKLFRGSHAERAERAERESGAVMVEMILVLPILIMFLFGIAEFGFAYLDANTISSASRSGARVGAGQADQRYADWAIIQNVKAATAGNDSIDIQKVVIYRATNQGEMRTANCLTGSRNNRCNHYTGAQIASLTASDFGNPTDTSCNGGAPDRRWCPTNRDPGVDLIGVYIETKHDSFTGFFGNNFMTITEKTVLRLEPSQ